MAKTIKKVFALMLALVLILAQTITPAAASPWDNWGPNNPWNPGGGNSNEPHEWYQVIVQGKVVASGQGRSGDWWYLGTHYEADVSVNGNIVNWSINPYSGSSGNFRGSVNLEDVISVPEGYEILNYTVDETSIGGVNDPTYDKYDNCVITVTVTTFYNPITQETLPVTPTEPEPTDPPVPAKADVTVNHTYSTFDVYTGQTVVDGSTSSTAEVTVGDNYTATAVPSYNENAYIQQTDDAALTIAVQADSNANVINITYLRTIDTTPQPVETSVTVNHTYSTYDVYTDQTVVDGSTSHTADAIEGDSYTAVAIPIYNSNNYARQTADEALTITVQADAAANVVNIAYLRTIDTTPQPVQTAVTVNHKYSTYDIYTGQTVVDGTSSNMAAVMEGDSYTATAISTYKGNDYVLQTADTDLTITVQADAEVNVINIEYLRTINTTPQPVETSVTVNHKYSTYDIYTGQTVVDGIASEQHAAIESETFTAEAIPGYEGNDYIQQTGAAALTIEVQADAEANVINIEYLRTINTTPQPVQTSVTVNHKYATYDLYTKRLTIDGTTSRTVASVEGQHYTATAIPTYQGVHYAQQTGAAAMSIIVKASAAQNVINIEYLRTVDTTPPNYVPVLQVTKTADKDTYEVGQIISWNILVKNISRYTAYDVVITDELTGDRWTVNAIAPGEEKAFTAVSVAEEAGTMENVAIAVWDDNDTYKDPEEIKVSQDNEIIIVEEPEPEPTEPEPTEPEPTEPEPTEPEPTEPEPTEPEPTEPEPTEPEPTEPEPTEPEPTEPEPTEPPAPVDLDPNLIVSKDADKANYTPGETIIWTITVKNDSQYAAHNIVVSDALTGDEWTLAVLAPGAEAVYTATSTAAAGAIQNIAVVTWEDNDGIEEPEESNTAQGVKTVLAVDPKPVQPAPIQPKPSQPEATQPKPSQPAPEAAKPVEPVVVSGDAEIEIPDEEVPLAEAPETGDGTMLWAAVSLLSTCGFLGLNKKRKK